MRATFVVLRDSALVLRSLSFVITHSCYVRYHSLVLRSLSRFARPYSLSSFALRSLRSLIRFAFVNTSLIPFAITHRAGAVYTCYSILLSSNIFTIIRISLMYDTQQVRYLNGSTHHSYACSTFILRYCSRFNRL